MLRLVSAHKFCVFLKHVRRKLVTDAGYDYMYDKALREAAAEEP